MTPDSDSLYCSGYVGTYEIEMVDGGDGMLPTMIEDGCVRRSAGFEVLGTRVTDADDAPVAANRVPACGIWCHQQRGENA